MAAPTRLLQPRPQPPPPVRALTRMGVRPDTSLVRGWQTSSHAEQDTVTTTTACHCCAPAANLPFPCRREISSSASFADESRQLLHISMQTAAVQQVRDEEEPPAVLNTLATRNLHSLEGCTSLLRVGAKQSKAKQSGAEQSDEAGARAPSQGRAP